MAQCPVCGLSRAQLSAPAAKPRCIAKAGTAKRCQWCRDFHKGLLDCRQLEKWVAMIRDDERQKRGS